MIVKAGRRSETLEIEVEVEKDEGDAEHETWPMEKSVSLGMIIRVSIAQLGYMAFACIVAQNALPASLEAAYWANDTISFKLRPPEPGLDASVVFDTNGKSITLDWGYDIPGSEAQFPIGFISSGSRADEMSLSYNPTAACRESGIGSVFYVAGWIERLSTVIIERWEVQDLTLESTTHPETGIVSTTLSLTYDKSVVLVSGSIGPIRGMEFHFSSGSLWILEDTPPNRLLEVDVQTGTTSPIADSVLVPELSAMRSMRAIYIKPTAPGGGGFYLILSPDADWHFIQSELQDPQSKVFFTRDSDFDGVLDEQGIRSLSDSEAALDYEFYLSRYN